MCALYSFPLRRIRRLPQLNSDKEYKTYSTDGISIEINSQCAMFYIRKSKSLTGGNTTQTLLDLPNGITLKNEVFAPCEIIDGSWTPYGNTGYINVRNGQINVRCKDSTSTSIVIAMFTVPRLSLIHISEPTRPY